MLHITHYVSIKHQTPESANTSLSDFVADAGLTYVGVNIQPKSPTDNNEYGGAYSSQYMMFAPSTASGIISGDEVTVSGTNQQFIVKGRNAFLYTPAPHLEFLLDEVLR